MTRTFVDRGGTFTDVVRVTNGHVWVTKVPSDRAVVGELAVGPLVFGTTVATNALLERRLAPTLLIVTAGFADLALIRDMARPALFDPDAAWPAPLHAAVIEVEGRLDADGRELTPVRIPPLALDGFASVAIALLHSRLDPSHEKAVADAVRRQAPHLPISLGHELSPEVGYLARIETTLLDAAVTPELAAAMRRDRIPADALAIRSDGGLVPAHALRAPDAVLSGPAGGVLAVAAVARQAGFRGAVGLDMGGTSTDVCCVVGDEPPRHQGDVLVAGVRIRRPMLEVDTIAAGGGSILSTDGIQLRVGPASAGASPGPQCYGKGGPPTLTDAALAMGLVDADAFDPPLQPDLVRLPGDADAFLGVAREAMAGAVRRLATARGVDLRDLALVAYGGAAGQHAAEVAARLGISHVLVHPCAAVLSAWGQTLARREAWALDAVWAPLAEAWPDLPARFEALQADLPALGPVDRYLELRHVGTDHVLTVEMDDALPAVLDAFGARHRAQYGFDRQGAVELVNLRVRTRAAPPPVASVAEDPWGLGPSKVRGPVLLTCPTTSVHVPAGWVARLRSGLLQLSRAEVIPEAAALARTPVGISVWGARFMSVAEQSGALLRRLARSVNIRERLDFSCAVFDGDGRLVANAPHIPVHLGAMGETVRDLIAHEPSLPAGQAWLTNAPDAGGSHLPDLTVVTPVHHGQHRFFVASRGHHVDVGGLTPGSMPPHSRSLDDEGLVFRRVPLLHDGQMRALDEVLLGCRQPEVVRADLEAQVAANAHAARLLVALGDGTTLAAWMAHLQDAAADAVKQRIASLAGGHATDRIGGHALSLAIEVEDGLSLDFTGTAGPYPDNLNAPPAVVRAAVLYALRVLVADDIPLNEGALRHVRITLPSPSLLAPPLGAAVAGGNVETSMRIVDLVLRALGERAAACGTMSNLTIGGPGWSLYETVAGGQGASPRGPGLSGQQVHMTNTRATDPEVLETRLPLRVLRFALRHGSGGDGAHRGGDGLVRELELRSPGEASLLATRRTTGAPGLGGGGEGAPGADAVRIGGSWRRWDGSATALSAGDAVRVVTPGGGGWG